MHTDEQSGGTDTSDQTGRFRSTRRDVLRLVGAGGALSLTGGIGLAQEGGVPQTPRTVHDVRLLETVPPTSPERPVDFHFAPTGLHVQSGDVVRFVFETPYHTVTSYHPVFGMQRRVPTAVEAFSSPVLGWRPDSLPSGVTEPPMEAPEGGPAAGGNETAGNQTAGNVTTTVTGGTATTGNATGNQTGGTAGGAENPVPSTWLYAFDEPGVYDVVCAPHETFGMVMRVVAGDVTSAPFETSNPDSLPEPRAGPAGLARVVLTDPALDPAAIVEGEQVQWLDLQANQGGTSGGQSGGGGANTNQDGS